GRGRSRWPGCPGRSRTDGPGQSPTPGGGTVKGYGPIASRKLRETEFFLEKLKAERSSESDSEIFAFYLSAFLSAFKAEIAGKEMTSRVVEGWQAKLPVEDQERLSFLTIQRNREVHHQGAVIEKAARRQTRFLVPTVQPLDFRDLAGSVETAFGPIDEKS